MNLKCFISQMLRNHVTKRKKKRDISTLCIRFKSVIIKKRDVGIWSLGVRLCMAIVQRSIQGVRGQLSGKQGVRMTRWVARWSGF